MDFYSDFGHLFAKLFHTQPLPGFVKEGAYEDSDTLRDLPDSAFADPISRAFPIHDRAHTWISAAYCYAQPQDKQAAAVLDRVEKQAELFGISNEMSGLRQHVASILTGTTEKMAGEEKVAAFEIALNTPTVASLRGSGKSAAQQAVDRFLGEWWKDVPCESRQKVAASLMEAAEGNGCDCPEDLRKFAGAAQHDTAIYCQQAALRASLIPDTFKSAAALKFLGEIVATADKVAALDSIDREHSLSKFYGGRILDPHRAVYSLIPKQAEPEIVIGTRSFPLASWEGRERRFFEGMVAALGEEKAASFLTKEGGLDLERLAGLPVEEANLLNQYLE